MLGWGWAWGRERDRIGEPNVLCNEDEYTQYGCQGYERCAFSSVHGFTPGHLLRPAGSDGRDRRPSLASGRDGCASQPATGWMMIDFTCRIPSKEKASVAAAGFFQEFFFHHVQQQPLF